LAYNWTIQQAHFPTFTPILDFVHVVEHIYAAARHVRNDEEELWQLHLQWTDAADNDPRKILAEAIDYFENNAQRRCATTTALRRTCKPGRAIPTAPTPASERLR